MFDPDAPMSAEEAELERIQDDSWLRSIKHLACADPDCTVVMGPLDARGRTTSPLTPCPPDSDDVFNDWFCAWCIDEREWRLAQDRVEVARDNADPG